MHVVAMRLLTETNFNGCFCFYFSDRPAIHQRQSESLVRRPVPMEEEDPTLGLTLIAMASNPPVYLLLVWPGATRW